MKRAQGWHGPKEKCLTKYDGSDPLHVIATCSPRDPDAMCWADDESGARVLIPWPEDVRARCRRFHADLIAWDILPERQKDVNRHAFGALLVEIQRAATAEAPR